MNQPTYWAGPSWLKWLIEKALPKKNTWTLNAFKCESGTWAFHLPQYLIFNEGLANGTEQALNYWFEHLYGLDAKPGDKLQLTLSSLPLKEYTTKALYIQDDPTWLAASEYYDTEAGMPLWLCPMLQLMFGEKPEKMWLQLK